MVGLEPEGVQHRDWGVPKKQLQKVAEGLQYKEGGWLQNMAEKVELPYLSPAKKTKIINKFSLSIAHRWWGWQWERLTAILLGW